MRKTSKKKRLIIPIFVPFAGCPHQCVFCDQKIITGVLKSPSPGDVAETVEKFLSTWNGEGVKEIAFYGGNFTGLEKKSMEEYLAVAMGFVSEGRVDSIRISTRPDYIDEEMAEFLKYCGVSTVEIGVESMDDEVLKLSGRGHTALDTKKAVGFLKDGGISVGMQLMPGLPGDTVETIIESARAAVELKPDFVRIYPTLVIKDTPLHRMYLDGRYKAWTLEDMATAVREIYALFKDNGITVARVGLHPSKTLSDNLVAGPYHPCMRDFIEMAARR